MTNMWDETEGTNTITPTTVAYAPPAQEATVQPQTTQSTDAHISEAVEKATGASVTPELQHLLQGLSFHEKEMLAQSINASSGNINAAQKGEGYTPTGNPGLDKVLQQLDTEAKEKAKFQQTAMSALAVPLAAGAGAYALSGEEESKTITDTAAKTTAVNATEVNSLVSMGTGFKEIFSKASAMFAGLSDGSGKTLESIKSGWQNMLAKANITSKQGVDVSDANLSTLTPSQTPSLGLPSRSQGMGGIG